MDTADHETQMTELMMRYKTQLDNGQITFEMVDVLLGIVVSNVRSIRVLNEQLDYAIETGGEHLEIDNIVVNN